MPFHNEVFGGDEDAVHMHSYLFPNANIVPSQTLPGSAPSSSSMHFYPPTFQNAQPAAFDAQAMAMQNSYFPPMMQMSSQQQHPPPPQQQRQPPPPPVRSLSMPHLSQSFSLAASLPATSPSAHSASSPTLLTPSPGAPSLPKAHEYRIRYNQACYKYNAQRPQSLPLDAGSFGRYVCC
jgi:hypothetical protein